MEKIWGPVNGLYVAAYAEPMEGGLRYCSYAKVCFREPASYWEADCLFKLFAGERHTSAEAALLHARRLAYAKIACIPPAAVTLLDIAVRSASRKLLTPLTSAIRSRVSRHMAF